MAANAAFAIAALARLLAGARTIAIGASSPVPAAAALLVQARSPQPVDLTILGSRRHSFFTDGGREQFDFAAQGRLEAFVLGGAQIDGEANINLVGTGSYPRSAVRFPGSFGSAFLYFVVPRVILYREEHTRRVLLPRVDFVSAPGVSEPGVFRRGGPTHLLTGRCLFAFDRGRFRLESVHPGHTVEEIHDHTGFDFDLAATIGETAGPTAEDSALMAGPIRAELAEVYPIFAASLEKAAA